MSLTSFVEQPAVRERLKLLRPDVSRTISLPCVAVPREGQSQTVGTAFDYLLRFEIERRSAKAKSRHWVAEHAPERLREAARGTRVLKIVSPGAVASPGSPPKGFARAARRVQQAVDEARDLFVQYIMLDAVTEDTLAEVATAALRLAKLDPVFRSGHFDPQFERVDDADVKDLLAMLAVVPFEAILSKGMIHLNPGFGQAATIVGGADADIIAGDLLIDIKASKKDRIQAGDLDQLLGYLLLARREGRENRRFPRVRRLALYYARFAYLAAFDCATWTKHPLFDETERWFFAHAGTVSADAE